VPFRLNVLERKQSKPGVSDAIGFYFQIGLIVFPLSCRGRESEKSTPGTVAELLVLFMGKSQKRAFDACV